jgi:SAM-dependent methyltransferase
MTTQPAADFESRRFQTAAAHYLAGRPPYPDELVARTAELVGLTPSDRLLDLGCGPGQLSKAFAPFVGEVVAMDPEPAMLDIARQTTQGLANVSVVQGRSDELIASHGRFKAVVIARAFHWMDRDQTLRTLDGLIEPGGAVVLIGEELLKIPENARMEEFRQFDRAWSADDRSHPIFQARERPHLSVLLASPFSRLEQVEVIRRHRLDFQVLADRLLSFSSTSRARLGDRAEAMLEDLRGKAEAWEAEGPLEEVLASQALIARRP